MKPIDLMLDNENELRFKISIEGTRPGAAVSRFMLEGNEMSYAFKGQQDSNGEVVVFIPTMKGMIKEGIYDTHLEVIVDDRVFIPLEMKVNFEQVLTVKAEAVNYTRKAPKASAILIEANAKQRNLSEIKKDREAVQRKEKPETLNDKQLLNILRAIKNTKK